MTDHLGPREMLTDLFRRAVDVADPMQVVSPACPRDYPVGCC